MRPRSTPSRSAAAAVAVCSASQRRHPEFGVHQLDLVPVAVVAVERRARVGSAGEAHARRERLAQVGAASREQFVGLADGEVRLAAVDVRLRRSASARPGSERDRRRVSLKSAMHSSSSRWPCSIESTPARSAFLIPCVPIACAAQRMPCVCASITPARSSSSLNCSIAGTAPLVRTPPVAMNLMQSAPALRCSRTARRTSHGPSDSRDRSTSRVRRSCR